MEITAIEPRRKRLVQLFLDGEPAVRLDAQTAAEAGLRPCLSLSDEDLRELLRQSDARRAREKALYLLEARPHTKKELEGKLARTAGAEAAQEAAARMEELGLVDDGDYARRYAAELLTRKGFAPARAVQELCRRGVERELARQAVEELAPPPEETLRSLVERKYVRLLGEEKGRRRAAAALQRLGWRWEEIRPVLRELTPGEEQEEGAGWTENGF